MKRIFLLTLLTGYSIVSAQTNNWKFYNPEETGIKPGSKISAIEVNPVDSSIWFGTFQSGLIKLRDNEFTIFNNSNSALPITNIWAMKFDPSGNLFIASSDTGLIKFDGDSFTFTDIREIAPNSVSNSLWEVEIDEAGALWCGTYQGGLLKFENDQWQVFDNSNSPLPESMLEINCITIDHSGKIWFGTDNDGAGNYDGTDQWNFYNDPDWWIYSMAVDNDGAVWSSGSNIKYYKNSGWIEIDSTLSDARFSTYAIAVDAQNNKWFPDAANGKGLLKFDDQNFSQVEPDNIPGNLGKPYSLMIDYFQNIWIGYTSGHIAVYKNSGVSAVEDQLANPENFYLYQNYPNPFNPATIINFALPEKAFVKLSVYNLLGEEISSLINGEMRAGNHAVNWNAAAEGKQLSNGIYFYKLYAEGSSGDKIILTRKAVLIK